MKKYTIAILILFVTLVGLRHINASKPTPVNKISAEVPSENVDPVQTEPEQATINAPTPEPTPAVSEAKPETKPVAKEQTPAPAPKPVAVAPKQNTTTSTSTTKATGSNANPAPVVIQNVNSLSKETFASCTQQDFYAKFLCLINNYRAENGKKALKYDSALNSVAAKYSSYMNTANFFSHVAPDGTHYYERCAAMNTTCHAENLAKGFLSAQNLFDMWRSSASHNANMLGNYSTMGLGISGQYATNLFRW